MASETLWKLVHEIPSGEVIYAMMTQEGNDLFYERNPYEVYLLANTPEGDVRTTIKGFILPEKPDELRAEMNGRRANLRRLSFLLPFEERWRGLAEQEASEREHIEGLFEKIVEALK